MPQATLSAARLLAGLSPMPSEPELRRILFDTKAELADWTGDAVRVEVTADRLDLLSEGGLRSLLDGVVGAARGLPPLAVAPSDPTLAIDVDPSVAPLRPAIGGVVVEAPAGAPLDAGLLEEAVRYQELLHATIGRGRRVVSLGLYPIAKTRPPFRYTLEPLADLRFTPLGGDIPVDGTAFYRDHPFAQAYGAFGRSGDRALVLRDAAGNVLSLPPVLNARPAGEATVGDERLLLEATGLAPARVADALGLLLLVFAARGWRLRPVAVRGTAGTDDGRALLAPRTVPLHEATIRSIVGVALDASEVERLLGRARLAAGPAPGGWAVHAPPWRPDLLGEVDVIEDLVVARGFRPDEGILPPTFTRGRRRPESEFRDRVSGLLLGLGLTPIATPVLVARDGIAGLGRDRAIAVANPVSELYSHVRDTLLVPLVAALAHNVRYGYPQRFSEVGPVVVPDATADSGGSTRYHAGIMIAHERAGFADAAAFVEYLLGALGTIGVREPARLPGTIPGRAARVRLTGETVAELGEIDPAILAANSVPVPAVWAELDLAALWPLLAPSGTA